MTYTPDQWEQIIASGIEAAGGGGQGGGVITLRTEYDDDAGAYTDVAMTSNEIVAAIQDGSQVVLVYREKNSDTQYYDIYCSFMLHAVEDDFAYVEFYAPSSPPRTLFVDPNGKVTDDIPDPDDNGGDGDDLI